MSKRRLDKIFLTGCDQKTEWQLPFFIQKWKEFKHKTPLVIANFGMSEKMYNKLDKSDEIEAIMNFPEDTPETGWFYKPLTMFHSPARKTVWLDTDCVFEDNIDDIFDHLVPNKLNMVEDKPWTMRRKEVWYNSGVVGFIDRPEALHAWVHAVRRNPSVGDQEVLHSILNPITQMAHINPLPNEYNVLRLQVEVDGYKGKKRVMHWTGAKGNEKIKEMMNG